MNATTILPVARRPSPINTNTNCGGGGSGNTTATRPCMSRPTRPTTTMQLPRHYRPPPPRRPSPTNTNTNSRGRGRVITNTTRPPTTQQPCHYRPSPRRHPPPIIRCPPTPTAATMGTAAAVQWCGRDCPPPPRTTASSNSNRMGSCRNRILTVILYTLDSLM
jgi:hypothetical protein